MKFSLPMIVGNLFQQAYTIVDSAIVGHYNGEAALAAVGASSALTTIFICVAIGGGIGAAVRGPSASCWRASGCCAASRS